MLLYFLLLKLLYSLSGNTGLLLLCEVAAKPFLELNHAVRVINT